MPLAAPLAEIFSNVRPLAPIEALETLRATPVVVAMVLLARPAGSVTLIVPPEVTLRAGFAPVDSVRPPSNLTVAPVFDVTEMPLPVPLSRSVMGPLKSFVPPV